MTTENKLILLKKICSKFHIKLLYLFGSQQKNALKLLIEKNVTISDHLTDIDVGVVFDVLLPGPKAKIKLYSQLYNSLEDLFLPYKLDLIFLEENHSVFQAEAINGICVYYTSEEAKDIYEEEILRRCCDFKPFLELYYQELLEVK